MAKITLTYYGHACFKAASESGSILFDPYEDGSVPGLKLPFNIEADTVFCSHDHHDHNARSLIRLSGKKPDFSYCELVVPHDDAKGNKRGMTKMTFVKMEGLTIAHLGDIGRLPKSDEYEILQKADIILLPCAGFYTVDSLQAKDIIEHLKTPSLKVLMHFREGATGYEVQEDIDHVMSVIPEVHRVQDTSIEIDTEAVPNETITLQPCQKR